MPQAFPSLYSLLRANRCNRFLEAGLPQDICPHTGEPDAAIGGERRSGRDLKNATCEKGGQSSMLLCCTKNEVHALRMLSVLKKDSEPFAARGK